MITSVGVGGVFSGEADLVIRTSANINSEQGVIYAHGAEAGSGAIDWMSIPTRWPLMRVACQSRVMLSSDLGGSATWGNDTVISRISSAKNYLQSIPGTSIGRVKIVAQSMGATGALAWAASNRELVSCIVLVIPVINLQDVYANSSYASAIAAAYGGSYNEATMGATHNPLTIAKSGRLNGIPMYLMYGTSDTLCKPEYAEEFGENCNMCQLVPLDGGHTEEIQTLIDLPEVSRFMIFNE